MELKTLQDPEFRYIPAAQTDAAQTWARFGYTPPDREKQRAEMLRLNPPIVETIECLN